MRPADEQSAPAAEGAAPDSASAGKHRRHRWLSSVRRWPAPLRAGSAGLVVGGVGVGLVLLGERGCEAFEGTSACGGGLGLPMLVLIVATAFASGYLLLRQSGIPDPGLTALLGTALPLVAVLAFLMNLVFSGWMLLVLPLLTAAGFAGCTFLVRALEGSPADDHPDG